MKKEKEPSNYHIDRLNRKGYGVSLGTEKNVEIPFSLPGEEVIAKPFQRRSALLTEIVQPAKERVEAKCVHFGMCGGCRLQHYHYDKQLQFKQELVQNCFPFHQEISPIIACDPSWEYRNKMEFSFSQDLAGEQFLGLMMHQGRGKVFHLSECHLAPPWFAKGVDVVRQWWAAIDLQAYRAARDTGSLRTLTMREGRGTGDRMVMLTVSGNADYALNKAHLQSFVKTLKETLMPSEPDSALSLFLQIHLIKKGIPTQFFEMHLAGPDHIREVLHVRGRKMSFHISPTAFFQPNSRQAEKLYAAAIEMFLKEVGPKKQGVIYDLFCGTGAIGICFAEYATQVIGIDLSPEAILDAKENATLNQCGHAKYYCGDVEKILKEETIPDPDLVIIDPPRVGLIPKAVEYLLTLNPPAILYISCNPTTQAENIAILMEQGYRIAAMQPVDQFPHTPHIENIALLRYTGRDDEQNEV